MRFVCIADAASAAGFRLAGIETVEAADRQEAREAFERFADSAAGVILVTTAVCGLIAGEIAEHRQRRDMPIVLEIPSRGVPGGVGSIGDFVRQALGVSI